MDVEEGYESETEQEGSENGVQEHGVSPPPLTKAAFYKLTDAGQWMSFLGIISFVGEGIVLISGIVSIALVSNVSYLPNRLEEGFVYIVIAVVCFFPSRFLFLAGSKLRALKTDGGADALEAALLNNKAYWKFQGILTIVFLAIAVLFIIVNFITTFVGLLSSGPGNFR
ncbi:MAG: hypothetical protein LBD86_05880 [Spirochaetaceae bacterium]|jgi:hypothetical protein|nr:hypothetical protein [Spirochaetaceae bacterium]